MAVRYKQTMIVACMRCSESSTRITASTRDLTCSGTETQPKFSKLTIGENLLNFSVDVRPGTVCVVRCALVCGSENNLYSIVIELLISRSFPRFFVFISMIFFVALIAVYFDDLFLSAEYAGMI